MNLRGAQATNFIKSPDPGTAGALIYGEDAMRVALKRQDLIRALGGKDAEEEMRLTRLSASEVRSDPAAVLDGLKSVGFFLGQRIVFVDGIGEAQSKPILTALDAWEDGDAALIVTAGALKKTSKLRKAFESHPKTASIGVYDDPMGPRDIDDALNELGLTLTAEGRTAIDALARDLTPGDLRQTLEKISLYAGAEAADAEAVAAMAPATVDTEVDSVILAAADGLADRIGPLMRRLESQGLNPVTLAIFLTRHFQQLHGIASGASQPWGRNRDSLSRQARAWGGRRLEQALSLLMDTDLTLRSSSQAPQMAVVERALLRLAMLARKGG